MRVAIPLNYYGKMTMFQSSFNKRQKNQSPTGDELFEAKHEPGANFSPSRRRSSPARWAGARCRRRLPFSSTRSGKTDSMLFEKLYQIRLSCDSKRAKCQVTVDGQS